MALKTKYARHGLIKNKVKELLKVPLGRSRVSVVGHRNYVVQIADSLAMKQSHTVLDLIQYLRFIIPRHYGIIIESTDDIIVIDLK